MGVAQDMTIVALDIGTSKITLLVVKRDADGSLSYIAGLPMPVRGVRNGVVVNISDVTAAIQTALYEVEEQYGRRITGACVSVSGPHLQSLNARSAGTITPVGREITHEDLSRAIIAARSSLHTGSNRDIIHEIPRAYTVDGQPGVHDPRGMVGYQLEVEVHYATGISTTIANLVKCLQQAGVDSKMLVAAPLAVGEAARAAFEHVDSLAVVDIGAETTNLAIYADGFIWSSEVLPLGGADITREVAMRLKLPQYAAEDVKVRYGHANPEQVGEFDLVDMPPSSGFDALLPRAEVARIIRERASAIAEELSSRLREARGVGIHPEVLVLAGGSAELPGLDDVLMSTLEIPTRRWARSGIYNLPAPLERPAYATAVGLVHWYANYALLGEERAPRRALRGAIPNLRAGMRHVFRAMLP